MSGFAMYILLVDDSRDTLDMYGAYFESSGHKVRMAESGPDALGIAQRERFDIIATDWGLPGYDGIELARRLRDIGEQTPMVLITGYPIQVAGAKANQSGYFSRIVFKPILPDDLLNTLTAVISESQSREALPTEPSF